MFGRLKVCGSQICIICILRQCTNLTDLSSLSVQEVRQLSRELFESGYLIGFQVSCSGSGHKAAPVDIGLRPGGQAGAPAGAAADAGHDEGKREQQFAAKRSLLSIESNEVPWFSSYHFSNKLTKLVRAVGNRSPLLSEGGYFFRQVVRTRFAWEVSTILERGPSACM